MKYITILEVSGSEAPNVGTLAVEGNIEEKFKRAIESHFDAEMESYTVLDNLNSITDCLDACAISVQISFLNDSLIGPVVDLSETWIY